MTIEELRERCKPICKGTYMVSVHAWHTEEHDYIELQLWDAEQNSHLITTPNPDVFLAAIEQMQGMQPEAPTTLEVGGA